MNILIIFSLLTKAVILVLLILGLKVLAHLGNIEQRPLSTVIVGSDPVSTPGFIAYRKLANNNFRSTVLYRGHSIEVKASNEENLGSLSIY